MCVLYRKEKRKRECRMSSEKEVRIFLAEYPRFPE